MERVWVFLISIIGISTALPQDMTGKMLVFPEETNTAHVRLTTSRQNLEAATVCLRFFTDLTRDFSVFSLSIPSFADAILIFKRQSSSEITVYVRNTGRTFKGQDYQLNSWQSVCATWEAASGLVQLWLDGIPSVIKAVPASDISGPMIIVLGQDQDAYGGGFDIKQSFVGMVTDVHMWDYVLPQHHLDYYSQRFRFPTGNILNWESLEFQNTGRVLVQKEQRPH